jgi:hypothetical protein
VPRAPYLWSTVHPLGVEGCGALSNPRQAKITQPWIARVCAQHNTAINYATLREQTLAMPVQYGTYMSISLSWILLSMAVCCGEDNCKIESITVSCVSACGAVARGVGCWSREPILKVL